MLKVVNPLFALVPATCRLVLALAVVFMMAIQPAVFARGGFAGAEANPIVSHHSPGLILDHHTASESLDVQEEGNELADRSGTDSSSKKSCEVHCAPAHAVPVNCPEIAPVFTSCFHPERERLLWPTQQIALVRPPRT